MQPPPSSPNFESEIFLSRRKSRLSIPLCQYFKQHRNHPPSGFGFPHPSGIGLRVQSSEKEMSEKKKVHLRILLI
jgi:hypothetical protein